MFNYIKKNKISIAISLVIYACYITFMIYNSINNEKIKKEYIAPKFDDLNVSEGVARFTSRVKSSGGALILMRKGEKNIYLSCSPPGYSLSRPCYAIKQEGKWIHDKDRINFKKIKVWWNKDKDIAPSDGRVYQIEVEGKMFNSFDQMAMSYN